MLALRKAVINISVNFIIAFSVHILARLSSFMSHAVSFYETHEQDFIYLLPPRRAVQEILQICEVAGVVLKHVCKFLDTPSA